MTDSGMVAVHDVETIIALTNTLAPRAVAAEVDKMRASVQGWKPRVGGRSADHAMPSLDGLDRRLEREMRLYLADIEAARAKLARAVSRQRDLLSVLSTEDARKLAEEELDGITCANSNCNFIIVPPARVLGGRCRPCYDYRRDHGGLERPRDLCDVSAEKRDVT